ncbi:MAG: hypothetical protein WEB58_05905 [Planctomycetaceae bacterium]
MSVWGDWNTYEQPSFVVDDKNHLPYRGPEVAYFNWMYGTRHYKPLQKKKYRSRADSCPASEAPPTFLGMPLFPSGRVSPRTDEPPQPIRGKSTEKEREASPAVPTADKFLQPHLPIWHEEPDDEFSFDLYPPSDLKSISGSGPHSPATE